MIPPAIPSNEQERLQALQSYDILDTLPEKDFDDISEIASELCGAPIALVSFIDSKRQWIKSCLGVEVNEIPRNLSICGHTILNSSEVTIVPDTSKDERFFDNPLGKTGPRILFYAGAPLVDKDGFVLGTLCIIDHEPRTLSKNKIKTLKLLANQVIKQVELKRKISELEQAQVRLQNANEEIRRFAYITSHDLKTPIRGVSFIAEWLKGEYGQKLDTQGKKYLMLLQNRAKNLEMLVSGILSFIKSDKGQKSEKEKIRLDHLTQEVMEILGLEKRYYVIQEKWGVKEIFANRILIFHVLRNLIDNAIKFADKTPVNIQLSSAKKGKSLILQVIDNGPGIDPRYHKKVFEMFQNLGESDRFGNKGSGLGLAMVKKMLEEAGGSIELDSAPGKGCAFTISLPL